MEATRFLIVSFASLFLTISCTAREITVDANGTGEYPTVQAAIDAANAGDVIELQPGTYTSNGNRDIDFKGKAITVRSTDPNDPNIVASTVVDCNGTQAEPHRGFYLNNGENANSILAGLTIINGYGHNEQFGTYIRVAGGGIFCGNASPTITKCRVQYNYASAGGGICCRQNNSSITNCIITNNSSDNGGGIYCGTIWADTNSPKIDNCIISNNSATTRGGGIRCGDNSQITNCVITSNKSVNGGGVGFLYATTPVINNSLILGNYRNPCEGCGGGGGGGVSIQHGSRAAVVNCTIANNETAQDGGGIDVYISSPLVENCIIRNNTAGEYGGYTIGKQICVRGNFITGDAVLILRYCDIEGGLANIKLQYEGEIGLALGNIDVDPCFADPCSGDYHLKSQAGRWDPNINDWVTDVNTSRCIDAGNPGFILGNELNEQNNVRIDMGVYGGTAEASKTPVGWALLADLTNDGVVDWVDFTYLASDWLTSDIEQPEDFDRSGTVDSADLDLFVEDWLKQTTWYGQ